MSTASVALIQVWPGVRLTMRTDQCTMDNIRKLKDVLVANQGDSDVYLKLVNGDESTMMILGEHLRVEQTRGRGAFEHGVRSPRWQRRGDGHLRLRIFGERIGEEQIEVARRTGLEPRA